MIELIVQILIMLCIVLLVVFAIDYREKWYATRDFNTILVQQIIVQREKLIDKACDYLYEWNKQQAIKYDARDILSVTEYTIDVNDFRKHLEEQK